MEFSTTKCLIATASLLPFQRPAMLVEESVSPSLKRKLRVTMSFSWRTQSDSYRNSKKVLFGSLVHRGSFEEPQPTK